MDAGETGQQQKGTVLPWPAGLVGRSVLQHRNVSQPEFPGFMGKHPEISVCVGQPAPVTWSGR